MASIVDSLVATFECDQCTGRSALYEEQKEVITTLETLEQIVG